MFLYGWNWPSQWMLPVDVGHTFITASSVWRQRGELSAENTLHVSPLSLIYNSSPQATYDLRGTIHLTSNTHRNPSIYVCVCESQTDRGMPSKEIKRDGLIINGCHFTLVIEEQWYCAFENNQSHAICFIFQQPSTMHMEVGEKKEAQTNRPH